MGLQHSLQILKNFAKSFMLVIISFLLMTFTCDSGMILWGETAGQRVKLFHVHMRKVYMFESQIQ